MGRSDIPLLYEGTPRELEPLYIPDPSVTPSGLRGAAQMLIDGFPSTLVLPKVEVKKIISLEDMIDKLAVRIQSAFKMSFKEFVGTSKSDFPSKSDLLVRQTVIVSFLALLELVKQGIIKAEQDANHGDITLESHAVSTPNYGN